MTPRAIGVLFALSIFAAKAGFAQNYDPRIGARVLSELTRKFPCRTTSIKFLPLNRLDPHAACVLTMALRHAIATGAAASIGVRPSDSAAIVSSMVVSMQFRDVRHPLRVVDAYWTAAIDFAGKVPPLDGYIDQRTGRIGFNPGER